MMLPKSLTKRGKKESEIPSKKSKILHIYCLMTSTVSSSQKAIFSPFFCLMTSTVNTQKAIFSLFMVTFRNENYFISHSFVLSNFCVFVFKGGQQKVCSLVSYVANNFSFIFICQKLCVQIVNFRRKVFELFFALLLFTSQHSYNLVLVLQVVAVVIVDDDDDDAASEMIK